MLVDSNHAKACFSSLRDHPAGVQNAFAFSDSQHLNVLLGPSGRPLCVQNAFAFSDSQHLNVLLGPSGRPLCVQNAFAFCQPLGHLTVNCYRFLFSKLNRSTACSLIRDCPADTSS